MIKFSAPIVSKKIRRNLVVSIIIRIFATDNI